MNCIVVKVSAQPPALGARDVSVGFALASLDSIGKVKRKEMLEAQLAQIEKDIEKLSKPTIYVRTDEDY